MNEDIVSCRDCKHMHVEYESWEMPHIKYPVCVARPQMSNLKSFPFMVTTCPQFESRDDKGE